MRNSLRFFDLFRNFPRFGLLAPPVSLDLRHGRLPAAAEQTVGLGQRGVAEDDRVADRGLVEEPFRHARGDHVVLFAAVVDQLGVAVPEAVPVVLAVVNHGDGPRSSPNVLRKSASI